MNIYVLLRAILHSLLAVINLLALTAAGLSISVSKGEGQPQASPGAVLVVVGSIAFVIMVIMTWAESCVPQTLLSHVRTEIALVPMLIVFQLISSTVTTSDAVQSICRDPASCVALLVLSWIAPFSLIVYYLMVLAVTFDHAKTDPSVWDASPLDHPWFLRPPPPPPKDTAAPLRRFSITPPLSLRTQPSIADHRRQRSSWMPPPLEEPPSREPLPSLRLSRYSARGTGSVRSLFVPKWAKDLKPLQRGLELPFPVQARAQARRWDDDPRRIDAPVSPSMYTEYS